MAITHYEILGVSPGASTAEIKAAFRRLSKVSHPDATDGMDPHLFRLAREAYEVLCDPARRRAYDAEQRSARPSENRPRGTAEKPGEVVVPRLKGLDMAQLVLRVDDLPCETVVDEVIVPSDDPFCGLVIDQRPSPGSHVRRGSTIHVTVTRAPTPAEVRRAAYEWTAQKAKATYSAGKAWTDEERKKNEVRRRQSEAEVRRRQQEQQRNLQQAARRYAEERAQADAYRRAQEDWTTAHSRQLAELGGSVDCATCRRTHGYYCTTEGAFCTAPWHEVAAICCRHCLTETPIAKTMRLPGMLVCPKCRAAILKMKPPRPGWWHRRQIPQ